MVVTYQLTSLDQDGYTGNALAELSLLVARSKRIVVVTGAGVSCSSGVPDFRSPEGLYDLVHKRYPDVGVKGMDLFSASLFRDSATTAIFYSFIAELKLVIDQAHPSPTHQFIKALHDRNRLLRSYTQNIDGFEAREGLLCTSSEAARTTGQVKQKLNVKEVKNVQLHGDIHRVRCMLCSADYPCSPEFLDIFRQGRAPQCPECVIRSADRVARSARSLRIGSLRPAIVLYDESHPYDDEIGDMCTADLRRKPDLLIIMGTSLQVHGIKKLVRAFAKAVHARPKSSLPEDHAGGARVVFVNKTEPAAEWASVIDVHVAGLSDDWVKKVIHDWQTNGHMDRIIHRRLGGSVSDRSMDTTKKPAKRAEETMRNDHAVHATLLVGQRRLPHLVPASPIEYFSNQDDEYEERLVEETIGLPPDERGVSFMQTVRALVDIRVVCLLLALALLVRL